MLVSQHKSTKFSVWRPPCCCETRGNAPYGFGHGFGKIKSVPASLLIVICIYTVLKFLTYNTVVFVYGVSTALQVMYLIRLHFVFFSQKVSQKPMKRNSTIASVFSNLSLKKVNLNITFRMERLEFKSQLPVFLSLFKHASCILLNL